MASLLIATTILSYQTIQKTRAKRAQKRAFDDTRFSELERDNAIRIAQLQGETCFCQESDWQGGGCDVHGYVPKAGEVGGPPGYRGRDRDRVGGDGEGIGGDGGGSGAGVGAGERGDDDAPAYEDAGRREVVGATATTTTTTRERARETYPDYRYRRGEEDGALAGDGQGPPPAPLGPMAEEEVRRINEERRKRMKAGGFTNWVLRRKGGRKAGDVVVR